MRTNHHSRLLLVFIVSIALLMLVSCSDSPNPAPANPPVLGDGNDVGIDADVPASDKGDDTGSDADVSAQDAETGNDAPSWLLFDILPNPRNGQTSMDSPRTSSTCTYGDGRLTIQHSRRSLGTTTVDVNFAFSFEAPPTNVPAGEIVEMPLHLAVSGQHISENAGATAGFLGYQDSLSVASCSLTSCPERSPEQSGIAKIRFPGRSADPEQTFEFTAYLTDTTPVGGTCQVRYVYEFVTAE